MWMLLVLCLVCAVAALIARPRDRELTRALAALCAWFAFCTVVTAVSR